MSTASEAQTDVAEKTALFAIKETPRYSSQIPPWTEAMRVTQVEYFRKRILAWRLKRPSKCF